MKKGRGQCGARRRGPTAAAPLCAHLEPNRCAALLHCLHRVFHLEQAALATSRSWGRWRVRWRARGRQDWASRHTLASSLSDCDWLSCSATRTCGDQVVTSVSYCESRKGGRHEDIQSDGGQLPSVVAASGVSLPRSHFWLLLHPAIARNGKTTFSSSLGRVRTTREELMAENLQHLVLCSLAHLIAKHLAFRRDPSAFDRAEMAMKAFRWRSSCRHSKGLAGRRFLIESQSSRLW